jgi:hypothetical protein
VNRHTLTGIVIGVVLYWAWLNYIGPRVHGGGKRAASAQ